MKCQQLYVFKTCYIFVCYGRVSYKYICFPGLSPFMHLMQQSFCVIPVMYCRLHVRHDFRINTLIPGQLGRKCYGTWTYLVCDKKVTTVNECTFVHGILGIFRSDTEECSMEVV